MTKRGGVIMNSIGVAVEIFGVIIKRFGMVVSYEGGTWG